MVKVTADQIAEMVRLRFRNQSIDVKPSPEILNALERKWKIAEAAGIADNNRRVAHFLAQCAHESDHFKTLEEYATGTTYEGRTDLGNTQPGDGPRYKGRGIIQLTGRLNFRQIGQMIDVDLEGNPERASEPDISVATAVAYWTSRDINKLADGDDPADVEAVTKAINGGMNGYDDRLAYYRAARRIWRAEEDTQPKEPDRQEPTPQVTISDLVDEIFAKAGPSCNEVLLSFKRRD